MKNVILTILLCLIFTGCSGSKDSKPMIDANTTTNEVRDSLTKVGLGYYGKGGAFNTQNSIVSPCEQTRLDSIDQSVAKLNSLENRLRANGQDSQANDIRQNYVESLIPIQKELNLFCSQDFEKLSSCLGTGRVLVYLNKYQMGFAPVSPVLIPFDLKSNDRNGLEYGIYRISNNGETIDFVRIYKDGLTSTDRLDSELGSIYRINHENLIRMDNCVSLQKPQTATGMQIQKFLSLAATVNF